MARRIIIGEILNLIKGLGGNPNKFMGTKSNINFLGKGPQENLFQSAIDIEGMVKSGFPIQKVISEAESAGGYVTAGKLNDLQLQRLKDNLISLKKAYMPEQVPNITDLGTGTKDLTQEGLGSLRTKQLFGEEVIDPSVQQFNKDLSKRLADQRFPKESHQFMGRPLKDKDFAEIDRLVAEGKIPAAGRGKGEPTKEMTYTIVDPTAEKASYASRFNPKNEVHVNKAKALLEDPQLKGVYTEAEVKNAYDFEGLYQSHFDKGHVDIAVFFEQAGHNIPQMRSSARDALLQLTKAEDVVPFAEIDIKYITEGGGGREGDPINLMVKYFGKNVTENLPKESTKESITKFTEFLMRAKDSRGRGIRDPFFDRETIVMPNFLGSVDDIPFKTGGRVGFKWGSGLSKALLKRINKKMVKDAVDDIFPSGDYKYDAELASEALVELNPKLFGGKLLDDLDDAARSDVYGLVLEEVSTRFGLQLKKNRGIRSLIKGVDEQFGEGTLKRASELPKGTKYETLEAVKDFEARNRTFTPNREMIREKYQGLIDDNLLNQILADNNPQRIAEVLATIDEALLMQGKGMGSQDIMAALRGSWGRKPNASGGLAKILEV